MVVAGGARVVAGGEVHAGRPRQHATMASSSDVSTTWPCPVRARASSASWMPCAANMPASTSAIAMPARVGPLSSVPVTP